ncbi:MAG TPA: hypothetical protein VMV94_07105 [Phycisphaerae bacterium]|nr:hypothetical protein [Phycisphaerae bacterium]
MNFRTAAPKIGVELVGTVQCFRVSEVYIRETYTGKPLRLTVGWLLLALPVCAQTGVLALASGSASSGGTATLNLSWIPPNVTASGLQWTLTYPSQSVAAISVTSGPAAIAANKSVICNPFPGSIVCVAAGVNANAIPGGVVAVVTLSLSAAAGSPVTLGVANTLGTAPDGTAIATSGTAATVSLPAVTASVTPASGAGSVQPFVFVFTDSAGYTAISSAAILINGSAGSANGCYLFFYQPLNAVYLAGDDGTAWQGPIVPGRTGTLQNSQCLVDAGGSSVTGSGSSLTVTLALTFQPAFAGAKTIAAGVRDSYGNSTWQQLGSWTVPAAGKPTAVSVTPNSGTGSAQTFSLIYSDPSGYTAINFTELLLNSTPGVPGGCLVFFYRPANTVYLADDAGVTWQGPLALGQAGTLQNSQCTINAANSSSAGAGNNLMLTLALSFQPAFQGTKYTYMGVQDTAGGSDWQQLGLWTVP